MSDNKIKQSEDNIKIISIFETHLPKDLLICITTFLDNKCETYPINDYEKYITALYADANDNDKTLLKYPNITILDCKSGSKFTDIGLSYLPNLKELYCGPYPSNNLTDAGLKYLSNLKVLHCPLFNTNFTDDGMKYLMDLRELNFGMFNNKITDKGMKYLKNLRELRCGFNKKLTDVCLSYLPNLEVLYCGFNGNFTDNGLSYLLNLKELHMSKTNNKFTDNQIKLLKKNGVKIIVF